MDARRSLIPQRSAKALGEGDNPIPQPSPLSQSFEESNMNKSLRTALVALAAGGALISYAHASLSDPGSLGERFRLQNQTWQQESTSMPAGSPVVDRSAKAADPVATATNLAQEEALFKTEDRRLQNESTGMAAGSPPVNRHEPAFDPMPKPATKAQRVAANMTEERFLQQESTK
jgi:hypothetical protein